MHFWETKEIHLFTLLRYFPYCGLKSNWQDVKSMPVYIYIPLFLWYSLKFAASRKENTVCFSLLLPPWLLCELEILEVLADIFESVSEFAENEVLFMFPFPLVSGGEGILQSSCSHILLVAAPVLSLTALLILDLLLQLFSLGFTLFSQLALGVSSRFRTHMEMIFLNQKAVLWLFYLSHLDVS